MRIVCKLIVLWLLLLPQGAASGEKGLTVKGVRYFSYAAFTRIVLELDSAAPYVLTRTDGGRSLLLSAYDGPFALKAPLPTLRDSVVSGLEAKEDAGRTFVVIRLDAAAGEVKDFVLRGPDRIVIDIAKGTAPAPLPQPGKLLVIVLDAGHGGKDTGIVTAQGQEKTLTLELAQAIRKALQKNPRIKVVLTREKDQALSLDERAAVANAAGANIFVSIHAAPGSVDRVFIEDPDEDADAQAARPASRDFFGFEAGSELQETLWGRQQAGHARESGALGRKIVRALSGVASAEPVQAPLAAFKPVDAAAILIEAGMAGDRSKTAEAVARGIEQDVRESR
jgi:N-acetylmuramoyl-L-alanine amidase